MRPLFHKLLVELKADTNAAWNNAGALETILLELNHRNTSGAKELKHVIEVRLSALRPTADIEDAASKSQAVFKVSVSKASPGKPAEAESHLQGLTPSKPSPPLPEPPRIKPVSIRDFCVVDVPGMNSVSMYFPYESSGESDEIASSTLPNTPSCIILPALPRDPIVAGEEALRHHQGIGDSWPPDAFLQQTSGVSVSGVMETSVPDRRLLLYRCWDALNFSVPASSDEEVGSKGNHSLGSVIFQWDRVDDAGGLGQISASEAISEEVLAVTRRHDKKRTSHFVVLIPEWLDDVSQQSLLNSLSHSLGAASSSVRLLWRSIAYALEWLESLPDDVVPPPFLHLLEAQPLGLVLRQFAVREFAVEEKRILCPVRKTGEVSQQSIDSIQALLDLAVGTSSPINRASVLRDLHLGKVTFFDTLEGASPVGPRLESVPSKAGLEFRAPPEPRMPVLSRLNIELSKVVKQLPKGATLLLFGALSKVVSESLAVQGIPHASRSPEDGVKGGGIFMKRARKGWPTYLDELPGLDLFVLKKRHRHWEPLIPEGTEIFGQEEYVNTLCSCVSVGRGNQALNSYLRRRGNASLRFLETKLPQPSPDDEPCDLRVTARSAGGLAVIEAVPSKNRRIFGESDTLKLDWESMHEASPEADGWPRVPYSHGYPKCGEIFSSQSLFENLLSQLGKLSVLCSRHDWRAADDEIGKLLLGAARASTPIGSARHEIQQMAPIGSLRPTGTRFPANFLDTSLPIDRCTHLAASHLHNSMKVIVATLLEAHGELTVKSPWSGHRSSEIGDRLFKLLTWLGGYFPAELMPRLREVTKENPNSENLTALGRCGRSPEDAALLLKLLVADKLYYKADGKGTANYLKCFIYLSFQHEGILQGCDREQIRVLIKHATHILEKETKAGNFKTSFVNALRTIALALRYRQYVTSGPQFLLCESSEMRPSNSRMKSLFGDSEIELAQRTIETLELALIAVESKAGLNRRRDGGYRPADDRKMKLVSRVKEWLEWKAPTDIWIGGLDDEGDDDNGS